MKSVSLRMKMIVGGMLIVLIPLVVVGVINFFYVSKSLEAVTREKTALVAENLASLVQASLDGRLQAISALAADPDIVAAASNKNYGKSLSMKMKKIFRIYDAYIEGAFITDRSGVIRADATDASRHGLDLSDREYFQKARAGIATISDPVFSKATGNPIVIVSAPIMANGRFVGVIANAIKIEYLLYYMSSIKLGKTGYSFMINQKGIVIAHPRKEYILKKNALKTPGVETIAKRMIAQQTGTEEYMFEGEKKMAGFAPIRITGWSVAQTQHRQEFMAPAHAIIRNLVILLPLALLVTVIAGVIAVRGISQPILDLSKAAKGLAEGKWQQVAETGRTDELGEVVSSFNSMSEQLQKLFVSLKESEAKYRQFVNTVREGIWVFGPDWKTKFVNASMAEMLGYAEEDIVRSDSSDFLFPEDVPDHLEVMDKRRQGISESHERRFRTKEGGVVWTIVSDTMIRDDEGHIVGAFAMLTNITGRKRAENALAELNQELEQRVSLRTAELASRTLELERSLAARDQAEAKLQRLYIAIESVSAAVIIADSRQRIVYANPAVESLVGCSTDELLGQSLGAAFDPQEKGQLMEQAMESVGSGHPWRNELYCHRKDGSGFWADFSLSGVLDEQGVITTFVGVLDDITEKRNLRQSLTELSYRDSLTGLSNRRRFDKQLIEEWRRCGRRSLPLSLIMIDIDHFKLYNDTWGHLSGDECLKKVANCVEHFGQRRAGDLVARYGGEEFVALLPDTDTAGACTVAEATRSTVAALNLPHPASLAEDHVTVSIGIASMIPAQGEDPHLLVAAADQMLYHSKSNGRNRSSVWPADAADRAARNQTLEISLHQNES